MIGPKKILVFGATGSVGRYVVAEALRRGHRVTGVVRNPPARPVEDVELLQGDASNPGQVRELAARYDVVVSATRPAEGREAGLVETARSLVSALQGTERRLIVVGGAARLRVPGSEGVLALDDPRFVPEPWRSIAQACAEQFDVIRRADGVDFTYVSPPASLEEGERTGAYRLDIDQLIVDDSGRSRISYADFAVAIVDEIETPRHPRGRFTVGYGPRHARGDEA